MGAATISMRRWMSIAPRSQTVAMPKFYLTWYGVDRIAGFGCFQVSLLEGVWVDTWIPMCLFIVKSIHHQAWAKEHV